MDDGALGDDDNHAEPAPQHALNCVRVDLRRHSQH